MRCPIVFQGHLSNFKVTRDKKLPILTWIEYYRIVTPVWIHWWLWNNAQSLMWPRRGALLFFEVIHLISRSYRMKNQWSESNFSKITKPVAAIKSLRFALLNLHFYQFSDMLPYTSGLHLMDLMDFLTMCQPTLSVCPTICIWLFRVYGIACGPNGH